MADFCEDLENFLRVHSVVSLYVGYGSAARVFPDVPPQGTPLPFIVYVEAGGDSEEHLTGAAGMCKSIWHIYAYGETRVKSNALSEALKSALRPFNGIMGGKFVTEVSTSTHRDSGVDQPQDGSFKARYWTRRIFDIWHTE